MKLRSVTYALLIAGVAAFSTSFFGGTIFYVSVMKASQTDSQHIAAKKIQ